MHMNFVIGVADVSCLAVSVTDIYLVPTWDLNNVNTSINHAATQYSGFTVPSVSHIPTSDGHWNKFKPHNSVELQTL